LGDGGTHHVGWSHVQLSLLARLREYGARLEIASLDIGGHPFMIVSLHCHLSTRIQLLMPSPVIQRSRVRSFVSLCPWTEICSVVEAVSWLTCTRVPTRVACLVPDACPLTLVPTTSRFCANISCRKCLFSHSRVLTFGCNLSCRKCIFYRSKIRTFGCNLS
jgi:hypothetical protein